MLRRRLPFTWSMLPPSLWATDERWTVLHHLLASTRGCHRRWCHRSLASAPSNAATNKETERGAASLDVDNHSTSSSLQSAAPQTPLTAQCAVHTRTTLSQDARSDKKKMSSANQPAHTQTQPRLCCTNTTPRDHEPLTLSLKSQLFFSNPKRKHAQAETCWNSKHFFTPGQRAFFLFLFRQGNNYTLTLFTCVFVWDVIFSLTCQTTPKLKEATMN